ncbi:outer membrane protein [Limoniibacter endophyticus]|uniref:Outer membrane protein n=1 Tax=Limoniibacter endophyticus TaxID=1565040 RepID=A0A8J3DMZ4_9HYPH|nr:outer membrane beta-barrel protein [Limoniibacter endophyticus]GHC65168.1 outer membrane protein [Limoniibacter endophyticus]
MAFSPFAYVAAAAIVLIGSAVPVTAQDLGGSQARFSGTYVGANVGVASRRFPNMTSGTALTGGVQAGFTHQAGPLVVGGELDLGHAGGQKLHSSEGVVRQDWNGAAKLKAGIALGDTLLFGTGGFGLAKMRGSRDGGTWEEAKILGAGVEQSIGEGRSIKVEYQRSRFDDIKTPTGRPVDVTSHAVKAGMNFRF